MTTQKIFSIWSCSLIFSDSTVPYVKIIFWKWSFGIIFNDINRVQLLKIRCASKDFNLYKTSGLLATKVVSNRFLLVFFLVCSCLEGFRYSDSESEMRLGDTLSLPSTFLLKIIFYLFPSRARLSNYLLILGGDIPIRISTYEA